MDTLEKLLAIEEIKRLKARYFRAMDMKDWDAFRSLFTDDIEVDTTEAFYPADVRGDAIEPALERPGIKPDYLVRGIVDYMASQHHHLTGVSTVHHGHMPEIEILSEDEATGIWAMEDKLRWPAGAAMRTMHGYGHYTERYRKLDGHWRIARLKLTRIRIDVEHG